MSRLDRIHHRPALKKVLLRLPALLRPAPRAYGFALGFEHQGRVVHNLQDPTGQGFAYVTNVVEHEGRFYLGSLLLDAVGRIRRPRPTS